MSSRRKSSSSSSSKRRPSSDGSTATTAAASANNTILDKIALLRNFCGDRNDYELTDCLRQSGYNVERAAERILTGQYKPSSKSSSAPSMATAASTSSSSTFSSKKKKQPPKPQKAPSTSSASNSKSATSNKPKNQRLPVTTARPLSQSSNNSNSSSSSSTTSSSSAKKAQKKQPPPAAPSACIPGNNNSTGSWILCQRWLSNAVCMTRGGSCAYQEPFVVQGTQQAAAHATAVRFRGQHLEGKLPAGMARFFNPLLRLQLCQVQAVALMACDHCQIGAHVPLQLTVTIPDPRAFFALFDEHQKEKDASASSSSIYWQQRQLQQQHAKKENNNNSRNRHKELSPADAAFGLLQWAEYGDELPDYMTKSDDDDDDGSNNGSSTDDDDDEVVVVQPETNGDDNDKSTEQGHELDQSLDSGGANWSCTLPECDAPTGFVNHVSLRPYQKQALHWMLQREGGHGTNGESDKNNTTTLSREQLQEQLQLLSELAEPSLSSSSNRNSPTHAANNTKGIVCECGPVCVSPEQERLLLSNDSSSGGSVHHPLWKRRYLACWPNLTTTRPFFVNELLGQATDQPPAPPQPCSGGILADAMGLGKTVMLLALILKSKELMVTTTTTKQPTLVIAKLSLLPQWEEELQTKTNLTYLVYYGAGAGGGSNSKKSLTVQDLEQVDVVVTTYGTVQGDYSYHYDTSNRKNKGSNSKNKTTPTTIRKPTESVLQNCAWFRIILDEAHCIRNVRTVAAAACRELTATHRWCVSGTIVQNSLQDVYGMMKFLRHEPWCHAPFWQTAITKPTIMTTTTNTATAAAASGDSNGNNVDANDDDDARQQQENTKIALDRVRRLLQPIMLRRTKDSLTQDGTPILTLPDKEIKTIRIQLAETEREFYGALLARSRHIFDGFCQEGGKAAGTSYIKIFALLSKLRQVCDHIGLTVQTRFDGSGGLSARSGSNESKDSSGSVASKDSKTRATGSSAGENSQDPLGNGFLEGLLDKFCSKQQSPRRKKKRADDSDTDDEEESTCSSPPKRPKQQQQQDPTYVAHVANMIASIVKDDTATHLNEECAICLEAPRVEDAVLTPCAHIFCETCLVNFLRQKKSAATTATTTTKQPKPTWAPSSASSCPDGECPNCNEMVQAKRIIALTRSPPDENGHTTVTSRFMLDKTKERNNNKRSAMMMGSSTSVKQGVRETQEGNRHAVARQILENAVRGTESSKMKAILQELGAVWRLDPGSKVLVFSHYLGFLDLLQMAFREEGIPYFRLDGSLTLKERMTVLEQFRSNKQPSAAAAAATVNNNINDPMDTDDTDSNDDGPVQKGTVLLMSMAAGAEGLNLVSASSCFICDPWWNGAKEDQCVNRIHRIGQNAKVVRVRKFVVQDSVEERIVQLQTRKQYMADEIYNDENKTGEMGTGGGRLSLEEFRMIFER